MVKNYKWLYLPMITVLCFAQSLCAEPFLPNWDIPSNEDIEYQFPTLRYLKIHPKKKVDAKLKEQSITLKQHKFYNRLIYHEERGHIGYHAASHHFRVFQDIIRMILEEILEFEFKKDFYFFRLPGDPAIFDYADANVFLSQYREINDNLPEQRDQLISVNFTLFSNFKQKYECTPVFFEKAISYKPPNFKNKIALLFKWVGMDEDYIDDLFEVGQMIEHPAAGTLFQIFDLSYQNPVRNSAYGILDQASYACVKKGVPLHPNYPLSFLYSEANGSHFLDQYRLVVNHENILNPYSPLTMRRCDLNKPELIKKYEQQMRNLIKTIPYDPIAANMYKKQLMKLWNIGIDK